jgi:hypothetical protein
MSWFLRATLGTYLLYVLLDAKNPSVIAVWLACGTCVYCSRLAVRQRKWVATGLFSVAAAFLNPFVLALWDWRASGPAGFFLAALLLLTQHWVGEPAEKRPLARAAFMATLLLVGAGYVLSSLYFFGRLVSVGVPVTAHVIDTYEGDREDASGRVGFYTRAVYEFSVNGQTYFGFGEGEVDFAATGIAVDVEYDPRYPANNRLAGQREMLVRPFMALILLCIGASLFRTSHVPVVLGWYHNTSPWRHNGGRIIRTNGPQGKLPASEASDSWPT